MIIIFIKNVKTLSKITHYPILADGISHLRFACSNSDQSVCSNYDAFLRSDIFKENHKPEIIIQFGRTVTSVTLQKYIDESKPHQYIVNKFGDLVYPSVKSRTVLKVKPNQFCGNLVGRLIKIKPKRKKNIWRKDFVKADELVEKLKGKLLINPNIQIEPSLITGVLSSFPSNTYIMIGNSLPIRDFDWFVGKTEKSYDVYFNRGTSGIDGVTSTALGIASIKKTNRTDNRGSFIHP